MLERWLEAMFTDLTDPHLSADDIALLRASGWLRAVVQRHDPSARPALVLAGSRRLEHCDPVLDALSEELTVEGIDDGLVVNGHGVRIERLSDVLAFGENFPLRIERDEK